MCYCAFGKSLSSVREFLPSAQKMRTWSPSASKVSESAIMTLPSRKNDTAFGRGAFFRHVYPPFSLENSPTSRHLLCNPCIAKWSTCRDSQAMHNTHQHAISGSSLLEVCIILSILLLSLSISRSVLHTARRLTLQSDQQLQALIIQDAVTTLMQVTCAQYGPNLQNYLSTIHRQKGLTVTHHCDGVMCQVGVRVLGDSIPVRAVTCDDMSISEQNMAEKK